jgi:hypothetical protein
MIIVLIGLLQSFVWWDKVAMVSCFVCFLNEARGTRSVTKENDTSLVADDHGWDLWGNVPYGIWLWGG